MRRARPGRGGPFARLLTAPRSRRDHAALPLSQICRSGSDASAARGGSGSPAAWTAASASRCSATSPRGGPCTAGPASAARSTTSASVARTTSTDSHHGALGKIYFLNGPGGSGRPAGSLAAGPASRALRQPACLGQVARPQLMVLEHRGARGRRVAVDDGRGGAASRASSSSRAACQVARSATGGRPASEVPGSLGTHRAASKRYLWLVINEHL
jgi:hypothetical protein